MMQSCPDIYSEYALFWMNFVVYVNEKKSQNLTVDSLRSGRGINAS